MHIIVSNKSDLPIYEQIKRQLKEQIMSGEIKENEYLPSIRTLAKELSVSVITTTRAYRDLEEEGFIASRQGKGSVVLSKDNAMIQEQYLKRIEEHFQSIIDLAKVATITTDELIEVFNNLLEEG